MASINNSVNKFSIENADIKPGTKVLVRVDFNIPDPVTEKSIRFQETLKTINYLHDKGARIGLMSHRGGDGTLTLAPLAPLLEKYLPVKLIEQATDLKNAVENLADGEAVLLENIRRNPGEEKNDPEFAKTLADGFDLFVNEAFSVSHRHHASVVGVVELLPSYLGLHMIKEIESLSEVRDNPLHPFVFISGGAKIATKIPLLETFFDKADTVYVAGALANTFFKAKDDEVGISLVDDPDLAKPFLQKPTLVLPTDMRVTDGASIRVAKPETVHEHDNIIDIGPESLKNLENICQNAALIVWNGPLGKTGFDDGTIEMLQILARSSAKTILGGGDTLELIESQNTLTKYSFVSTGGGATLDFLASGTLPAIEAVIKR